MKEKPGFHIHHMVIVVVLLFQSGCAMLPEPTHSRHIGADGPLGRCADFFAALDQRIAAADAFDAGSFRVKDYPYLRVNRFLASFREEVDDRNAFAAWIDQLQAIDQYARYHESLNLSAAGDNAAIESDEIEEIKRQVAACGDRLKAVDFKEMNNRDRLANRISIPDEYLSFRRVLGLYAITRVFVSFGVSNWHDEARKDYSMEPSQDRQAIRYVPEKSSDMGGARRIVEDSHRDALGIPKYSPEAETALFQAYAPVWEVQSQGEYDRIGTPFWTDNGALGIDTRQPVTFTHLSFTRFAEEILTQLNYIIWFSSRPKENAWDIYGGLLDGVNFRVTLDRNGVPQLYETMHNCGCYYKAYPTDRLQVRKKIDYGEPPLILGAPEIDYPQNFMAIAMESRTHYVRRLFPLSRERSSDRLIYSLKDYGKLLSLTGPYQRRKSMFNPNGIAPGSERLERFLLWSTGVLSPGAMRRWGRHAVAFVGKRQFDDPFFMDKMFINTPAD